MGGGGGEWGQGVLVEKTITTDMEVWGRAWSPGCLEGPGGARQGHQSSLGGEAWQLEVSRGRVYKGSSVLSRESHPY